MLCWLIQMGNWIISVQNKCNGSGARLRISMTTVSDGPFQLRLSLYGHDASNSSLWEERGVPREGPDVSGGGGQLYNGKTSVPQAGANHSSLVMPTEEGIGYCHVEWNPIRDCLTYIYSRPPLHVAEQLAKECAKISSK